ncbi:MAG: efflux RND transporter periplasmic adaptor subunit [Cyanobacteria bacterium P01_F01_bin.150]
MSDLRSPKENSEPKANGSSASKPKISTSPRLRLKQQGLWLIGLGAAGLLLAVKMPMVQTQLAAQESKTAESNTLKPLAVETLTVEVVDRYTVARAYTGEVAAPRTSELGFTRGGELMQVLVEEGDRVTSGQPLAQLDTQSLQAQKRQLEAQTAEAQARMLELERGARQEDIDAANAEVRDIENQLKLQEQQRSRRQLLYDEGAISREQLDEIAFSADALNARLDKAKSNLAKLLNGTRPEQVAAQQAVIQQLKARIESLNVDLSKSVLRAPFDGIVSTRHVDEGVVVGIGQEVVRLVENKVPEARIGMPETIAVELRPNAPVTVSTGSNEYSATVKAILPEVNPDTRTQIVVFQLEAAALRANPGQTVRVELNETIATSGIWVPTQALTQDIRGLWSTYVLTSADTTEPQANTNTHTDTDAYIVQPKSVEILHQESDRVLVRGTLEEGDRIVANGIHRLVPGQRVRPL